MSVRLAINGFGRIGRAILRHALTDGSGDVLPVAVNAGRGTPEAVAHLFRYDSVFGRWPEPVRHTRSAIVIGDRAIEIVTGRDPRALPWRSLEVDVVAEATGSFLTRDGAARHLAAGAGRVLVTAPMTGEDLTIVIGVNDHLFDPHRHRIVSGASCTTSCLAPLAMVLHDRFGIRSGLMTTIHAMTRDQEVLDGFHEDLRRAGAAGQNMVPTRTGAARALDRVLPAVAGRIAGLAVRVPVPDVSLVDLDVMLERPAAAEQLVAAFRQEAAGSLRGVMGVCDEPLVSSDFRGDARSCVVDTAATRVAPGGHAKILAWYDNEWAYAARMLDLIRLIGGGARRIGALLAGDLIPR